MSKTTFHKTSNLTFVKLNNIIVQVITLSTFSFILIYSFSIRIVKASNLFSINYYASQFDKLKIVSQPHMSNFRYLGKC
jgi:hypothetical protein